MKTMDKILIIIALVLLIYTIIAIYLFYRTGTEMTTLTSCIFASCTGEAGVMGWIKTNKIRQQDRQWVKEDRNEHNN